MFALKEKKWTAKRFYGRVVLGAGASVGVVIGVFYLFDKYPALPVLLGIGVFMLILEDIRRELND